MIKHCAIVVGYIRALPHLLAYGVAARLLGRERAFRATSEAIAKIPGDLGVYARQAFYKVAAQHVGRDVYFGFMSVLSKPDVRIGDRVYLGRFCCVGLATLESDVMLADSVHILSGRHQHGDGHHHDADVQQFTHVTLGAGAWVGTGAIVMADVGPHAIVGAGAVVVQPVPDHATAVGVPAKPTPSSA